MAKFEKDNVKFSGINENSLNIGRKIGASQYILDANGNINDIAHKNVVNAIDIDWNNATIDNKIGPIKTTADLINIIANRTNGSGDGNSIPIYDEETINRLSLTNELPSKYIGIDSSLNDSTSNLNIIQQLMFTVNELQKEVTKLRNTFIKGIYSYNGEATYMSNTVAQYGDEEEPLWAIDESELSEINGFEFDYESKSLFIDNGILQECTENRMFLYTTLSNSNAIIKLTDNGKSNEFIIDINSYVNCGKCNVMLIISRKPQLKDIPNNYVYLVITDYINNKTLRSGYITVDHNLTISETQLDYAYYLNSIELGLNNSFHKFNVYVQDRDFNNEIIPEVPDNDETSYRVAHIAVRSVKNYDVITKIKNQLVNNEFIIDESKEKLYIKINNKIINIGAPSSSDETDPEEPIDEIMTNQEIIKALESQGVITILFVDSTIDDESLKYSPSNIIKYSFNSIGSIRFTHEDTGKTYEYTTNAYGQLESKLIENQSTLAKRLEGATIAGDFDNVRGLVGQLGEYEYSQNFGKTLKATEDHGLYADRIKIASVYAPLVTDVVYGCSHAYIELENTSNTDFNLDGCYLHYIRKSETTNNYIKSSLKLKGVIPAGSTYLIRGKKYIKNDNDSNCFIHIDNFDQEWYVDNELIDLSMNNQKDPNNTAKMLYGSYVLILSYHGNIGTTPLLTEGNALYKLIYDITDETISDENNQITNSYLGSTEESGNLLVALGNGETWAGDGLVHKGNDTAVANSICVYAKGFIDALAFNTVNYGITSAFDSLRSNSIYRGTYELDPAKQAFNGLTKRDSSRERWEKKGNDYQYLDLNKEYIEFPKSSIKRNVNYFAPKASFEHKNVITDKTKFNKEKPNAVTVSYGENMYTTRCFNWLSSSKSDEYVWIYDDNNNLIGRFESYKYTKTDISQQNTGLCHRKEFPAYVNNIVYCDYRTNTIIDRQNNNKDVTYSKYATADRACGLFAGSNEFFVSHKCIIEFNEPVLDETRYSYIVGQSDKYGNPNEIHCSEKRYFTLYPKSYKPVIYQITDQQGFHWIEYQVWAAAAERLNKKINKEIEDAKLAGNPIMPILINTGDCTQSGSRVNEWLDYFAAGDVLFNHLEQNNIVGNNDLNGTDIQSLGTGDDPGKSNGYYFYIFNCNEVNNFFTDDSGDHYPIVNNTYVPSLYYIGCENLRIVCVNSEITVINCSDWFNLRTAAYENNNKEYTVNIYTGYTLRENDNNVIEKYVGNSLEGFTPIYTLLWHAFNDIDKSQIKCIAACHEMPFTVMTQACCAETKNTENLIERFRSISDAASPGKLIGSHLNQMLPTEDGAGVYWFSRLLEYSDVRLCIGGHKHTYAITYPVRENYKYIDGYDEDEQPIWKSSLHDGPMTMNSDLSSEERTSVNDYKVLWKWAANISGDNPNAEYPWYATESKIDDSKRYKDPNNEGFTKPINWSKLPIVYRGSNTIYSSGLQVNFMYPAYPLYEDDAYSNKAVIYIMSQATGYKLTSNKELPTPAQRFSMIVPETENKQSEDVPDNNQKYPMYIKYDINKDSETNKLICKTYLARAINIFDNKFKFTQIAYNTSINNNINDWHYLVDKGQCQVGDHYIQMTNKHDTKNAAQFNTNAEYDGVYDNYGLWVNNEKQMINDIIL